VVDLNLLPSHNAGIELSVEQAPEVASEIRTAIISPSQTRELNESISDGSPSENFEDPIPHRRRALDKLPNNGDEKDGVTQNTAMTVAYLGNATAIPEEPTSKPASLKCLKGFKIEYVNKNTANSRIATVTKNKGILLMQIWKSGTEEPAMWGRECVDCGGVLRPCFSPDGRYAQFHDGQEVFVLNVDETSVTLLDTIPLPTALGYKAIAVAPNGSLAVLASHRSDESLPPVDLPEFEEPNADSNRRIIHVLTPPRDIRYPCLQYSSDGNRVFVIDLQGDGPGNYRVALLDFHIHSAQWSPPCLVGIDDVVSYVPLMGYMQFDGNDYMAIEVSKPRTGISRDFNAST
jgi:hypothetical protein